ncbi:hypothetical protein CTAYLR_002290 [Chrysophaeum taylorii]|uniref:Uncharacterized protein n=1 Tax=Chrysophaeum taylorii TaxID=2483200 RepID=A0AAD7UQA2_9STRA|nr:hypothetical protein CTAYLR_002290 [Chrysophaeum taylorii]
MPLGEWWLRGLEVEVVDANGSVPLTEVYLHHVAFYDGSAGVDMCGGANLDSRDSLWDVGAESRGTRTMFPDGYGYPVTNESTWTANIHLIRSEGALNVKRCIECANPDGGGGSEDVCADGSRCAANTSVPSKDYFVSYTVYYDREPTSPVTYRTLDATACQLEFNVPAACPWSFHHAGLTAGSTQFKGMGLTGTGFYWPFDFLLDPLEDLPAHCVATRAWTVRWDQNDGRLVFGKGHLHIGAIDMSLYRLRANQTNELLCRVVPTYGAVNNWPGRQTPGDEKGYVVGISNCDLAFQDEPYLRHGDLLRVEARYRQQPWYDGVMALFDIAVADDDSD